MGDGFLGVGIVSVSVAVLCLFVYRFMGHKEGVVLYGCNSIMCHVSNRRRRIPVYSSARVPFSSVYRLVKYVQYTLLLWRALDDSRQFSEGFSENNNIQNCTPPTICKHAVSMR